MGISFSKEDLNKDTEKSISSKLDYIATYYIFTSNFESLKDLYNKEYCDDLVVLTSEIIQKNLTYREVEYMQGRIVNGELENSMKKEPMVFYSKSLLAEDYNKNITDERNKSRMCIGIAKFYIKVAHIFASIITSVNPIYTYSENGVEKQVVGDGKNTIPSGVSVKINKGSVCQKRLSALMDGNEYIHGPKLSVGTNLCSIKPDGYLIEDPGIPELEALYYDEYDYINGKFYGMSEESKKMYEKDVKLFYKIFTKSLVVPEDIKKFSDIKIKFYDPANCQGEDAIFKRIYEGSPSESLFYKYSQNIKKMIKNTSDNQEKLVDIIINNLFVFTVDKFTGDKIVRVDPLLTMSKLDDIVVNTRRLLTTLYLTCEADFNDGVEIFQNIAQTVKLYKTRKEISDLERGDMSLYTRPQKFTEPVKESAKEPVKESAKEPVNTESEKPNFISQILGFGQPEAVSNSEDSKTSVPETSEDLNTSVPETSKDSGKDNESQSVNLDVDKLKEPDQNVAKDSGFLGMFQPKESEPQRDLENLDTFKSRPEPQRNSSSGILDMFKRPEPQRDLENLDTFKSRPEPQRDSSSGILDMFKRQEPQRDSRPEPQRDSIPEKRDSGDSRSQELRFQELQKELEKKQRELQEQNRKNEEAQKRELEKKTRELQEQNRKNDEKRKREYEAKLQEIKKSNSDKERESKKKEQLLKETKYLEDRQKKEFESNLAKLKTKQERQVADQKRIMDDQIAKQKRLLDEKAKKDTRDLEDKIAKQKKEIEALTKQIPKSKTQDSKTSKSKTQDSKTITDPVVAKEMERANRLKAKIIANKLQIENDKLKGNNGNWFGNIFSGTKQNQPKAAQQPPTVVPGQQPPVAPVVAPVVAPAVPGQQPPVVPVVAPAVPPVVPGQQPPVVPGQPPAPPPTGPQPSIQPIIVQPTTQTPLQTSFGPLGTDTQTIELRKTIFNSIQQQYAFPYKVFEGDVCFGLYDKKYLNCRYGTNVISCTDSSIIIQPQDTRELTSLYTGMQIFVNEKEGIFIEFKREDEIHCFYYELESQTKQSCLFFSSKITTYFQYAINGFVLYKNPSGKLRPGIVVAYGSKNNIYSLKNKKILDINYLTLQCFFNYIKYGATFPIPNKFFGSETYTIQNFDVNDNISCIFTNGKIKPLEEIIIDGTTYSSCPLGYSVVCRTDDTTYKNILYTDANCSSPPITYNRLDLCRINCDDVEGVFAYNEGTPFLSLNIEGTTINTYIGNIQFTTELIYDTDVPDSNNIQSYDNQKIKDMYIENLTSTLSDNIKLLEKSTSELNTLKGKKTTLEKKITLVFGDITQLDNAKQVEELIKAIGNTDPKKLIERDKKLFDSVNKKAAVTDIQNFDTAAINNLNKILQSQTFIPLLQ